MWRNLLIAILLALLPTAVWAQSQEPRQAWQSCRGVPGGAVPVLQHCRPVDGIIDPQGRELWLRSVVNRPAGDGPTALYVVGVASSEVWLNGKRLGANGQPGGSRATEVAGRYQMAMPIPERMWRPTDNVIVIHMSSFHGSVPLDWPILGLLIAPYPSPSPTVPLAVTFLAAGALFAAAFGFGVVHFLRRTGSSLTLAALAGVSGLQAILESLRTVVAYAYPVHGWRLVSIWFLTAVFAVLLVSWVVSRFWPGARRPVMGIAVAAVGATSLLSGFDLKTGVALLIGLVLSALVVAVGVRRRLPSARLTLAYLIVFITIAVLQPASLIDLSYFLFAAGLLLPLMMAEVVRLGRDDQQREEALIHAVARPSCLTVASSRGVEQVLLEEIVAIVGADDYVELRLTDGRQLLHAARLDRLEAELPASFLRVHRSAIANLTYVCGYERDGGRGRLLMRKGRSLPVSRKRLGTVRDAIDQPVSLPSISA